MCLIIQKCVDDYVTEEFLADVWKRNNDGWGILYNHVETGEPVALKGLDFPSFMNAFNMLDTAGVEFIIHMRMATHGNVNMKNCHPFKVMDGVYLMHNGMFNIEMGKEKKLSDTRVFIRDILRPLLDSVENPIEFMSTYMFQHLIDFYVEGQDSRLVIYTKDGPMFFGTWKETTKGLIVSNHYAFRMDNPVYANQATVRGNYTYGGWPDADSDMEPYSSGYFNSSSSRPSDKDLKDIEESNEFYPAYEEGKKEYDDYIKSIDDAIDNIEWIGEHYWGLTSGEISYVQEKVIDGEWVFEQDDNAPSLSSLYTLAGERIDYRNIPTYHMMDNKSYSGLFEDAA